MLLHWSVLVLLAGLVTPGLAQDCPEGDAACDEALYQLEEALFMYESGAASGLGPDAASCLRADTTAWRTAVARACLGIDCKLAALRDRLAVLDPMQPVATALADWTHPLVPGLVAVIGPEEDEAGAPKDPGAPPSASAEGQLVHAGSDINHMGLAVRDDAGAEIVIVADMEIGNQPAHATLQQLTESGEGRFLVRGVLAPAADGRPDFDQSRCRFVHRIAE